MNEKANITLTASAKSHILRQLELTQATYLRLGVKESGCNGFMYMLDFLETPAPGDSCFDFGSDVRVCVSADHLTMVEGTEVDMITEGLNSALVFKNPNATSYCGCGESFAVASNPQDAAIDKDKENPLDQLATDIGRK